MSNMFSGNVEKNRMYLQCGVTDKAELQSSLVL